MKRDTVISCTKSYNRGKTITMVIDGNYQQLDQVSENEEEKDEHEETPRNSGVMIQVVPESGKSRWNHIEDLDSFFTRVYHYHQHHGFTCMMLQEVFELGQFIFVVSFSIFLLHCVDYSILFKEKLPKNSDVSISDAILPTEKCLESMGLVTWTSILVASIFWLLRFVKVLYHFFQFWDIKSFFSVALKIDDKDLDNLTWHEVQKKIIEVQKEQEMCIHKRELTELDIYHRVLRFKNYTVAMVNKSLLPIKLHLPLVGNIIFMTRGLKYNLELVLFWGPWSPFENNWHLQEDYKKINKRHELARSLSKHILWIGVANFVLCPLIFLWQILYFFFNYGELVKREPGTLGTRIWSLYGRLYLRHFNELDHELNARLNRAYRPASKYMSMFTSPLVTIIAKNVAFISGSIFAVLLILSCYDEDFFTVRHVLFTMTITGSIATICRSLVPDENLVWCPESLLTAVLAHTHYSPDTWRNKAHTQATRTQFAELFQYRVLYLLEELLSPILTPYILCFQLRCKALDIVDFFRNFTIEVTGVGDICSFAQMDVKKHGNPKWQTLAYDSNVLQHKSTDLENLEVDQKQKKFIPLQSNEYTQAEDGKTELSLIHFTLTNPEWKPPNHAEYFVMALRERAKREATNTYSDNNPLFASLSSLSSVGAEYNDALRYILHSGIINQSHVSNLFTTVNDYNHQAAGVSSNTSFDVQNIPDNSNNFTDNRSEFLTKVFRRGVTKIEGSFQINERGFLHSLKQVLGGSNHSFCGSDIAYEFQRKNNESAISLELTAIDMSLSALYLHELHHRQIKRSGLYEAITRSMCRYNSHQERSVLPELRKERMPLLSHQQFFVKSNKSS